MIIHVTCLDPKSDNAYQLVSRYGWFYQLKFMQITQTIYQILIKRSIILSFHYD